MEDKLQLPPIITLGQYGGNFSLFYEAAYQIFKADFVYTRPVFQGKRLGLKKYPLVENKECTFYHMTSEGKDETNRKPDLRRLERIPYPKPIINNSTHKDLKVWRNKRNNDERILIFHESENYLVVLAERGGYILPWNTYYIEFESRKRKLLKEYEAFKNAETA